MIELKYFLVQLKAFGKEKLPVTKKQLVWLLKYGNLDQLEILAIKPGECKGEYIDSYERRKLRGEV